MMTLVASSWYTEFVIECETAFQTGGTVPGSLLFSLLTVWLASMEDVTEAGRLGFFNCCTIIESTASIGSDRAEQMDGSG